MGVPGHLFGYCTSVAACIRIQDALQNPDLMIIKVTKIQVIGLIKTQAKAGVLIKFDCVVSDLHNLYSVEGRT